MTYYAVANVNGPISRRIEANDVIEAISLFENADRQAWIDSPATDAENDLGIDGEGLPHVAFTALLLDAGLECVANLDQSVRGDDRLHGWELWAAM